MISKETFINTMHRLEALDSKMDKADVALKELSSGFCGLYIPEIVDIVVELLRAVFKDEKHDALGCFIYELDFLRQFKMGSVTVDGKPIDLSTWDKVYDFLIERMEEE